MRIFKTSKKTTYSSISIMLCIILMSCKTYTIKEKDRKLIPYAGNEVLHFKSDSSKEETLQLLYYDTSMNESGDNIFTKNTREQLKLIAKNTSNGLNREELFCFLVATPERGLVLEVLLWDFASTGFTGDIYISDLKPSDYIKYKQYDDVIAIKNTRENKTIPTVYWSLSKGLVKVESTVYGTYELVE